MSHQNLIKLKAQRFATRIVRLPFVKKVSLTGSQADDRADENSDIDLFIQVRHGRLYISRLIVTVYVHLCGQRRTSRSIPGKICLNCFATYNEPKIKCLKYIELATRNSKSIIEKILSGKFGDKLEKISKNYQTKRFSRDSRTHQLGSRVRWSDIELGFHPVKSNHQTC